MADEKKNADYQIDSGSRQSSFNEPEKPFNPPKLERKWQDHPMVPIFSYCLSSIAMTVANKFVLLGDFNLNFFFLCLQSVVCVTAVHTAKTMGFITFRNFNADEARKWFPVSVLLVGMIYTGSKALKFLSIPVYTIFKNLTIIITAYGEVLWLGGSVTRMMLFSFGLIVLSSVIAAWGDIQHAINTHGAASTEASEKISTLNAGYMWMFINCFCTTSYVLGMRKRIKITNFKDFDTMFYNNLLTIPVLIVLSVIVEDWSAENVRRCFPEETRTQLISAIALTGIVTVFISYTSAWCVRVTSGATYSMVGALNKIPIALSGLVFFGDPITFPSVSAITIGSASGIVYAVAKLKQQEASKGSSGLPLTNKPVISASSQSARDSARA